MTLQIESAEIVDIPEIQYHHETGHGKDKWLTRSMLCDYIQSKDGYGLRHVEHSVWGERGGPSESMKLGTYLDVMITEGMEEFGRRYVSPDLMAPPDHWVTPSGQISRSKAVQAEINDAIAVGHAYSGVKDTIRAWELRMKADNPQAELLDDGLYEKARFLRDQLLTNPMCASIIGKSNRMQTTIRAVLANGLRVQCRLDLVCEEYGIVADLKTTNKTKERFLRSAVDYGYHVQAWLYSELANAVGLSLCNGFLFVCQMNAFPFTPYVLELPREVTEWGGTLAQKALRGIAGGDFYTDQRAAYVPFTDYWLANLIDAEESEDD